MAMSALNVISRCRGGWDDTDYVWRVSLPQISLGTRSGLSHNEFIAATAMIKVPIRIHHAWKRATSAIGGRRGVTFGKRHLQHSYTAANDRRLPLCGKRTSAKRHKSFITQDF